MLAAWIGVNACLLIKSKSRKSRGVFETSKDSASPKLFYVVSLIEYTVGVRALLLAQARALDRQHAYLKKKKEKTIQRWPPKEPSPRGKKKYLTSL